MIIDIETDPRMGLQVMRYHTWSVHRRQSVGEHSAQVARIMFSIWPDCPRELLVHAIIHDIGEMVGDLPWPVKRNDPVIKEQMDLAEDNTRFEMSRWGQPHDVKLTAHDRSFFKMCESIEMWEFGLQEENLGNKYATVVATRMLIAACELVSLMPPHIKASAKRYIERRREQESETELVPVQTDPSDETMGHVEKMEKQS